MQAGVYFNDKGTLMVTVRPNLNSGSDWWCENATENKGGVYIYSLKYIQKNLVAAVRKPEPPMRVFIKDIELHREEIDLDKAIRVEIKLADGSWFYIYEDDGVLVVSGDGRIGIEPRAVNMVYVRDLHRNDYGG
jgi:hypothetical protein